MSDSTVTINGQTFPLSSLRCKHLKEISKLISEGTTTPAKGIYSELAKFMPYVAASIKEKVPTFDETLLDELTAQEFMDVWGHVVLLSGIKVIPQSAAPSVTPPVLQ